MPGDVGSFEGRVPLRILEETRACRLRKKEMWQFILPMSVMS